MAANKTQRGWLVKRSCFGLHFLFNVFFQLLLLLFSKLLALFFIIWVTIIIVTINVLLFNAKHNDRAADVPSRVSHLPSFNCEFRTLFDLFYPSSQFFAEIIELLFVEHCAHSFSFNVFKKMQIVTGLDFDKLSGVYNNETIFLWWQYTSCSDSCSRVLYFKNNSFKVINPLYKSHNYCIGVSERYQTITKSI